MEDMIDIARQKRSTARTDANEVSSRSHAIFHIKIVVRNTEKKKPKTVTGTITIVDLAGSERLSQSHTEGDRLNETKAINKSLTALRDVISALYKKEQHIPYRNSKLTSILQNYLGKDSKTLVIINVSPCVSHVSQTLGSLKFGNQLKQCSFGVPTRPKPMIQSSLAQFSQESASKQFTNTYAKQRPVYNRLNSGLKSTNPITQAMIRKNFQNSAQKESTHMEGRLVQPSLMESPKYE